MLYDLISTNYIVFEIKLYIQSSPNGSTTFRDHSEKTIVNFGINLPCVQLPQTWAHVSEWLRPIDVFVPVASLP